MKYEQVDSSLKFVNKVWASSLGMFSTGDMRLGVRKKLLHALLKTVHSNY